MWWVILILRKLLQTAMHWQNWLFLTPDSLTFHLFFLDSVLLCFLQTRTACSDIIGVCTKSITWYKQKRHRKLVERQNGCHGDTLLKKRMRFT